MHSVARTVYRRIYWSVWAVLATGMFMFVIASVVAPELGALFCCLLMPAALFWLVLGPWIATTLVPLFISHVQCPGCHISVDMTSVWHCGCGFNDHRRQHLLAFHCPICGRRPTLIDCPRCQSTILLW